MPVVAAAKGGSTMPICGSPMKTTKSSISGGVPRAAQLHTASVRRNHGRRLVSPGAMTSAHAVLATRTAMDRRMELRVPRASDGHTTQKTSK